MITKSIHPLMAYALIAALFLSPVTLEAQKRHKVSSRAEETEGRIILAYYDAQKKHTPISSKVIADILATAQKVMPTTDNSSAEDFRVLWPTAGENEFTHLLATNGLTTLQDFIKKIINPHRLNASIKQWMYRYNQTAGSYKKKGAKTLFKALKQAVVPFEPAEEKTALDLYSIFFRAYAVRAVDNLKPAKPAAITTDSQNILIGSAFYELLNNFSTMPSTDSNASDNYSNIFADPILHSLGISDPDSGNAILRPLYNSQPTTDFRIIMAQLEEIAGPEQKLLTPQELDLLLVPINAQDLNAIIQRPITRMNTETARIAEQILNQCLHSITTMNNTINNASQNVGPYKKASDELAKTTEPAIKSLTDLKQVFNDIIKKLTPVVEQPAPKSTSATAPVPTPVIPPAPIPANVPEVVSTTVVSATPIPVGVSDVAPAAPAPAPVFTPATPEPTPAPTPPPASPTLPVVATVAI